LRALIATLFIFVSLTGLYAQPFTNLVLEGGGVRGIAYAGSIRYLEEKGLIKSVTNVGGTSAGAIAALTIALGYSSAEIEDLIYNTRIQKFNDGKFIFVGGVSRLNRNFGWYRGKAFTRWLADIIEKKTGDPDITFGELKTRGFKNLYVTGTSLNTQKLLVFSHETYPDMKIKDAVRISMSIPFYFEAVYIDKNGHVKNRREVAPDDDLVVDGGLTGNYPIAMFDDVQQGRIPTRVSNPATLGLRIDTPEQIRADSLHQGLAPIPIHRFRHYVAAFYNYVIENLNRNTLTPEDWARTVSISSGTIGPKIRKLSAQEKNLLISNGYNAMKDFAEK
jgi:NTE family protein